MNFITYFLSIIFRLALAEEQSEGKSLNCFSFVCSPESKADAEIIVKDLFLLGFFPPKVRSRNPRKRADIVFSLFLCNKINKKELSTFSQVFGRTKAGSGILKIFADSTCQKNNLSCPENGLFNWQMEDGYSIDFNQSKLWPMTKSNENMYLQHFASFVVR